MKNLAWAVLAVLAVGPTSRACHPAVSYGYRQFTPYVSTVRVQALLGYSTGATLAPYAGPACTSYSAPAPAALPAAAPCPRAALPAAADYAPTETSALPAPAGSQYMPYAQDAAAVPYPGYAGGVRYVRRRVFLDPYLAGGHGVGAAFRGVDYGLLVRRLGFDAIRARLGGDFYHRLARAVAGPIHHTLNVGVRVGGAVFAPRARPVVVRARHH